MRNTKIGDIVLAVLLFVANVSVIVGIILGLLNIAKWAIICSILCAIALLIITIGWAPRGPVWRKIVGVFMYLVISSLPFAMLFF